MSSTNDIETKEVIDENKLVVFSLVEEIVECEMKEDFYLFQLQRSNFISKFEIEGSIDCLKKNVLENTSRNDTILVKANSFLFDEELQLK